MTMRTRPIKYAYYDNDNRRGRIVEYMPSRRERIAARISQAIWVVSAALTGLIALRFLFKFFAVADANPFAALVYDLTNIFVAPFMDLIAVPAIEGDMAIELPVLLAIATYMLAAWLAVRIVVMSTPPESEQLARVKVSEWRD